MLTDKLNTFTKQAINTFLRFPLAMLIAIFGAIVAMALVDAPDAREIMLIQILLTTLLGLPLAVSVSLISGFNKWKLTSKIVTHLIALALMILFYFHLPNFDLFVPGKYIMRFVFFIACAWLTVFFLPLVIQRAKDNIFWNYIYSFFAHLALTIVFTGILYGGLSFTILAVDKLLIEIPYNWHIYERLWIFIAGIVAVWFFLSKMPKSIKDLDTKKDYPKYLQALSNFILVPVITAYGLILYIYGVRSLITWSVPKGEVIYLFTVFFVIGICINFIVSPDWFKGRKWLTDKFLKYYFITVIPLLILYFVAIGIRLSDYGITESRYFVVLFGVWLLITAIYFLIKKRQFIIIPISIFVLILITLFGPWGSNAVSKKNQVENLNRIFIEKNLLVNGKLDVDVDNKKGDVVTHRIKSIMVYLIGMHDIESIQPFFKANLKDLTKNCGNSNCSFRIIEKILPFKYQTSKFPYTGKYFNFERVQGDILDVKGYDYLINIDSWNLRNNSKKVNLWNNFFDITYNADTSKIVLMKDKKSFFSIDIGEISKGLDRNYNATLSESRFQVPAQFLQFIYKSSPYELKIFFENINGRFENGQIKITAFDAVLALKKVGK